MCTRARACAHTHTHPAPCSGPGWRAQRRQLVSYVNNLCLQTPKAQLRQGFSPQDGEGRKGLSEPPKFPHQEQGYKLSPNPSLSHTPFLSPQVGSSLGASPVDQGTHSQTARHFSWLHSVPYFRGPYPRPQGRGHCAPWHRELAHFGDNEIGHQLFVLFQVLSNQGHGAVHHLQVMRERSPEGPSGQGGQAAHPRRQAQSS